MKNLLRVFSLLFVTGLMFTACEDDPVVGTEQGPTVSVSTTASTVTAGDSFTVTVNGTAGDGEMNDLTIYEDGAQLDATRITSITGISVPNNPQLLSGSDRSSFNFDITITAHTTASANSYSFEVTDTNSKTSSESVTITVESDPPTITYMGPDSFDDVTSGTFISLPINAVAGSTPMDSISVLEDTDLVDPARLELGGTTFTANPDELLGDWKNEIMENLLIRVHSEPGVTKTYTVIIKDESGMTSIFSIPVSTASDIETLNGVLFNAGGPVGKGGLDLDNGDSTGSGDSMAEIRDLGIDTDLDPAENWIQRIVGVNGYEARYLFPGQNGLSETFTFGDVSAKSELADLWANNSDPFTSVDGEGNTVSFIVEVGDIFIISNGTNIYMVEVTEVNVTTDDNDDNYVVNIKK